LNKIKEITKLQAESFSAIFYIKYVIRCPGLVGLKNETSFSICVANSLGYEEKVSLNIKSEILCGDFSLMFYKNNNG
jgi:hypothetical protein